MDWGSFESVSKKSSASGAGKKGSGGGTKKNAQHDAMLKAWGITDLEDAGTTRASNPAQRRAVAAADDLSFAAIAAAAAEVTSPAPVAPAPTAALVPDTTEIDFSSSSSGSDNESDADADADSDAETEDKGQGKGNNSLSSALATLGLNTAATTTPAVVAGPQLPFLCSSSQALASASVSASAASSASSSASTEPVETATGAVAFPAPPARPAPLTALPLHLPRALALLSARSRPVAAAAAAHVLAVLEASLGWRVAVATACDAVVPETDLMTATALAPALAPAQQQAAQAFGPAAAPIAGEAEGGASPSAAADAPVSASFAAAAAHGLSAAEALALARTPVLLLAPYAQAHCGAQSSQSLQSSHFSQFSQSQLTLPAPLPVWARCDDGSVSAADFELKTRTRLVAVLSPEQQRRLEDEEDGDDDHDDRSGSSSDRHGAAVKMLTLDNTNNNSSSSGSSGSGSGGESALQLPARFAPFPFPRSGPAAGYCAVLWDALRPLLRAVAAPALAEATRETAARALLLVVAALPAATDATVASTHHNRGHDLSSSSSSSAIGMRDLTWERGLRAAARRAGLSLAELLAAATDAGLRARIRHSKEAGDGDAPSEQMAAVEQAWREIAAASAAAATTATATVAAPSVKQQNLQKQRHQSLSILQSASVGSAAESDGGGDGDGAQAGAALLLRKPSWVTFSETMKGSSHAGADPTDGDGDGDGDGSGSVGTDEGGAALPAAWAAHSLARALPLLVPVLALRLIRPGTRLHVDRPGYQHPNASAAAAEADEYDCNPEAADRVGRGTFTNASPHSAGASSSASASASAKGKEKSSAEEMAAFVSSLENSANDGSGGSSGSSSSAEFGTLSNRSADAGELGQEPSEDVRYLLTLLLALLLQRCSPRDLEPYLLDVAYIARSLLSDSHPAVLAVAPARVVTPLARLFPHALRPLAPALIYGLLPLLRHRHARVRLSALSALEPLLHAGGSDLLRDLAGFREGNVIVVKEFFEGGSRLNFFAALVADPALKVRARFYALCARLLECLADRHDYETLIMPYLLSGVADEAGPTANSSSAAAGSGPSAGARVCVAAARAVAAMGEAHERDPVFLAREDVTLQRLADARRARELCLDSCVPVLPPPFAALGRPGLGCRVTVLRFVQRLLPAVLEELGDWRAATQRRSLTLLRTLLVYAEGFVNAAAPQLVRAFCEVAAGEEDAARRRRLAWAPAKHMLLAELLLQTPSQTLPQTGVSAAAAAAAAVAAVLASGPQPPEARLLAQLRGRTRAVARAWRRLAAAMAAGSQNGDRAQRARAVLARGGVITPELLASLGDDSHDGGDGGDDADAAVDVSGVVGGLIELGDSPLWQPLSPHGGGATAAAAARCSGGVAVHALSAPQHCLLLVGRNAAPAPLLSLLLPAALGDAPATLLSSASAAAAGAGGSAVWAGAYRARAVAIVAGLLPAVPAALAWAPAAAVLATVAAGVAPAARAAHSVTQRSQQRRGDDSAGDSDSEDHEGGEGAKAGGSRELLLSWDAGLVLAAARALAALCALPWARLVADAAAAEVRSGAALVDVFASVSASKQSESQSQSKSKSHDGDSDGDGELSAREAEGAVFRLWECVAALKGWVLAQAALLPAHAADALTVGLPLPLPQTQTQTQSAAVKGTKRGNGAVMLAVPADSAESEGSVTVQVPLLPAYAGCLRAVGPSTRSAAKSQNKSAGAKTVVDSSSFLTSTTTTVTSVPSDSAAAATDAMAGLSDPAALLPKAALSAAEAAEADALLALALARLWVRRLELRALLALSESSSPHGSADVAAVVQAETAAAEAALGAAGATAVAEGAWPDYLLLRARLLADGNSKSNSSSSSSSSSSASVPQSVEAVALAAHECLLARLAAAAAVEAAATAAVAEAGYTVRVPPMQSQSHSQSQCERDGYSPRAECLENSVGRLPRGAVNFTPGAGAVLSPAAAATEATAHAARMKATVTAAAGGASLGAVRALAQTYLAHVL